MRQASNGTVPQSVKYAIVGAGIHGLSTALHLAQMLKATGRGSGADILVIDKTSIAGGASGIACGVVRNNYFQPAMRELMAHSVDVWESDPKAYAYHPVGYMQISPECMHEDVASIYEQQKAIGYESEFIEGAADCQDYMTGLFDDWQAKGITSVLHEKRGGYANNTASIYGLADKAEAEGVRILTGVEVKGFEFGSNSGAVTALDTTRGRIGCDYVIVGAGPWVSRFWNMLELPKAISIKGRDGKMHDDVRMWTYWCLEEGTLGVDPEMHNVAHISRSSSWPSLRMDCIAHRAPVENLLRALDLGVDIVGGIPHFERTMDDGRRSVVELCDCAADRGLMVDLHCDETDDPHSRHIETFAVRPTLASPAASPART